MDIKQNAQKKQILLGVDGGLRRGPEVGCEVETGFELATVSGGNGY